MDAIHHKVIDLVARSNRHPDAELVERLEALAAHRQRH
jgi:hypothetical protein